ncbi:hypothetical protein K402DRAFT_203167 [Aulographum hederae CBS 113979]|uniref:Uncharacterized protein n=1 Tax=Aulographum hederae CBS 113979 TaxID=1176131 RepID=A0A6G1HC71_9PEZI|nr:hypothetical protein K402DRAFT_203167 [Aulographum hederae CBS 113979]
MPVSLCRLAARLRQAAFSLLSLPDLFSLTKTPTTAKSPRLSVNRTLLAPSTARCRTRTPSPAALDSSPSPVRSWPRLLYLHVQSSSVPRDHRPTDRPTILRLLLAIHQPTRARSSAAFDSVSISILVLSFNFSRSAGAAIYSARFVRLLHLPSSATTGQKSLYSVARPAEGEHIPTACTVNWEFYTPASHP